MKQFKFMPGDKVYVNHGGRPGKGIVKAVYQRITVTENGVSNSVEFDVSGLHQDYPCALEAGFEASELFADETERDNAMPEPFKKCDEWGKTYTVIPKKE